MKGTSTKAPAPTQASDTGAKPARAGVLSNRLAPLTAGPDMVLWVRRFCIFLFLTYAIPGVFSAYRAWVQVKSLDLIVANGALADGDVIRVHTASWARTFVTVRLVLVQGERAETLAVHRIPPNVNASIDPRAKRDAIVVTATAPVLARFARGAAVVRAVAIGGPQWMRTPPPVVREVVVQLR